MPNRQSNIPKINKLKHRKRCKNCGKILDVIWFTAMMTEEWVWTGKGYDECSAKHSLVSDPQHEVLCPYCGAIVGTGYDFGFGEEEYLIIGKEKDKPLTIKLSTRNF
jgi:DNA-directed RNA polymerase subunit RPC12/RpoP